MNELERCLVCDGWGWVRDPTNRYGEELPCPGCNRRNFDEEMLRRLCEHPQTGEALAAILEELRERTT